MVFVGSLRAGSCKKALARLATSRAEEAGAELRLLGMWGRTGIPRPNN